MVGMAVGRGACGASANQAVRAGGGAPGEADFRGNAWEEGSRWIGRWFASLGGMRPLSSRAISVDRCRSPRLGDGGGRADASRGRAVERPVSDVRRDRGVEIGSRASECRSTGRVVARRRARASLPLAERGAVAPAGDGLQHQVRGRARLFASSSRGALREGRALRSWGRGAGSEPRARWGRSATASPSATTTSRRRPAIGRAAVRGSSSSVGAR